MSSTVRSARTRPAACETARASAPASRRLRRTGAIASTFRARMAVDRPAHGLGLGGDLLMDAVRRVVGVSAQAGVRALLVHALHERAQQCYMHHGFQPSPLQPLVLLLRLDAGSR